MQSHLIRHKLCGYGHSSNLESSKKLLFKNMFFHDILNVWHHFVSSLRHPRAWLWPSFQFGIIKKTFYLKICFSMTFWRSHHAKSLNSTQTRVVMAIVPIRNEKTTFYWIICYLMTFWKCDITSSLLSSPTRVVMAIVPIWNHQKNFLFKNMFFHDILKKSPCKVT